jgi:hypothetical protein
MEGGIMQGSGEVLRSFYAVVVRRDFVEARKYLADDLIFEGLFETYPNAEAVTLVAEWHQVRSGKIYHVASAFDGRPFAAMFGG